MDAMPRTLPAFFWHFIRRRAGLFFLMLVMLLAWSLELALWPVIIGKFVDALKEIESTRHLFWPHLHSLVWVALLLWVGTNIAFRIGGFIWANIMPKTEAEMRMEMFDYVQGHSHKFFSDHLSGTLVHNINTMVVSFTNILDILSAAFLPTIGMFLISVVLFAFISPFFALILLVWVLIHMFVCILYSPRCCEASHKHGEVRSILQGSIVDSLINYVSVKLFAHEKGEREYIQKIQDKEIKAYTRSELEALKLCIILGILTFLGAGVGLHTYMFYAWKVGWMTSGEVIFAITTTWNAVMMAWWVGTSMPWVFNLWGLCMQSLNMIKAPHDIVEDEEAVDLVVTRGEIVFEDVTFGFEDKKNIFQNKNLVIHHNEKVGLVGYSGAGKTTFVQLILRFYGINKGRILIDGQNIDCVTINSLRRNIAAIPQDPQLFHRSVRENIRYGRIEATDEEVIEAAKLARCHEFIEALPNKYDTVIGAGGIKLSGGQRQRIAIARAFIAQAPILMLDEATSALDSKTEKEIQDALQLLMEGRTTLVIAHRLSTLRNMDRILVFHQGKVVEEGTHNELVAKNGVYATLWNLQAKMK